MPAAQDPPKTAFFLDGTTDAAASQYLKIFTKNLDLRRQPAGGGFRSGNGRINDAVYRVGAWPAVQNFCAASGDFARFFASTAIWPITFTNVIGATRLQIGYLGEALLKFLIFAGRFDGTKSSQSA